MDIVRIKRDTLAAFELIMTKEALDLIGEDAKNIYALGAVSDGMPVGAAAVVFAPPEGRLISLYVVKEYRKQGIGTMLGTELLNTAMAQPGMETFVASYTEGEGEDIFGSFFNSMFFDVERVGTEYIIRADHVVEKVEEQKMKATDKRICAWEKLLSAEKKLLLDEEMDLSEYMENDQIREDLSFVMLSEDRTKIESCLIFAEVKGELVLVWTSAVSAYMALAQMIAAAADKIKSSEPEGRIIHLPSINDQSKKFIEKLFGNRVVTGYVSYRAQFPFA